MCNSVSDPLQATMCTGIPQIDMKFTYKELFASAAGVPVDLVQRVYNIKTGKGEDLNLKALFVDLLKTEAGSRLFTTFVFGGQYSGMNVYAAEFLGMVKKYGVLGFTTRFTKHQIYLQIMAVENSPKSAVNIAKVLGEIGFTGVRDSIYMAASGARASAKLVADVVGSTVKSTVNSGKEYVRTEISNAWDSSTNYVKDTFLGFFNSSPTPAPDHGQEVIGILEDTRPIVKSWWFW